MIRWKAVPSLIAALLTAASLGADPPEAPALETFVSEAGGYRVDLPAGWHHKEIAGNGVYRGFHTREPQGEPEDTYTYGLEVRRFLDYTKHMKFDSRDPKKMAEEYAFLLAGEHSSGDNYVIGLPTSGHGIGAMSKYFIVADANTKESVCLWLLAGVTKKQWFEAVWRYPCAEAERVAEVTAMIQSLEVDPRWPSRKR